jgi:hypothetical protein
VGCTAAGGAEWTEPFLEYVEYTRQGSDEFGYAVQPSGAGGGAGGGRDILPWYNLDQVSIRFSEPVSVQQDDLAIASAAGRTYNTTAFAYDDETDTATWTLDRQITDADVLTLRLDGDGPAGVTDLAGNPLHGNDSAGGDGEGGGPPARDFLQTLSVLPGDVNRDGRVLARDFTEIRLRFFSSTTNVDGSYERYSIFHDVDGSGIILARDAAETRKRFFTELPDEDDGD